MLATTEKPQTDGQQHEVAIRPILFSGPMVRSILAGRKTQTRRIVKFAQPCQRNGYWPSMISGEPKLIVDGNRNNDVPLKCPYGGPGERLWVRETWSPIPEMKPSGYFTDPKWVDRRVWYRADNDKPMWGGKWKPSIHMPRWASRITLTITGIRIERLNSISEEDAMAEGIFRFATDPPMYGASPDGTLGPMIGATACEAYRYLWESINGKGSWDANPWVWVVEFSM